MIYENDTPGPLGAHDFQAAFAAIRPKVRIDVVMTTLTLHQKYESLLHPVARYGGLTFDGIQVVSSDKIPDGEVLFLSGIEVVGKLTNRTA
jgi:hypothetical protein